MIRQAPFVRHESFNIHENPSKLVVLNLNFSTICWTSSWSCSSTKGKAVIFLSPGINGDRLRCGGLIASQKTLEVRSENEICRED